LFYHFISLSINDLKIIQIISMNCLLLYSYMAYHLFKKDIGILIKLLVSQISSKQHFFSILVKLLTSS